MSGIANSVAAEKVDSVADVDPLDQFHHLGFRWAILAIYCLINFAMLYSTMGLAGLSTRFILDAGVSPQDFSFMMQVPTLAGFILCFFVGGLSDKFGVKKVLTAGLTITVIACFWRPFVYQDIWMLSLANFLLGSGFGVLNSTVQKAFGAWFSPRQFSLAIGIYVAVGSSGSAAGMASAIFFPDVPAFLWATAIVQLVIFALMFVLFKDKPEGAPNPSEEKYLRYLKEALKHKGVWIVAIAFFLLYGAMSADNAFFVTAVVAAKGSPEASAAMVGSLTVFGAIAGSLVISAIVAKIGHSRIITIATAFVCAVLLFVAWNIPYGPVAIGIFACHIFCVGGLMGQVKALPAQLSDLPREYVGAAGGFQSTLQNLGGFLIPTYVVALIAGNDYQLMYNVIACTFLAFALVTLLIPKDAGVK